MQMHDGNDLNRLGSNAVDQSVRKAQDTTLAVVTIRVLIDDPIEQRLSLNT